MRDKTFIIKTTWTQYFETRVEASSPEEAQAKSQAILEQAARMGDPLLPQKTEFNTIVVPSEMAFEE